MHAGHGKVVVFDFDALGQPVPTTKDPQYVRGLLSFRPIRNRVVIDLSVDRIQRPNGNEHRRNVDQIADDLGVGTGCKEIGTAEIAVCAEPAGFGDSLGVAELICPNAARCARQLLEDVRAVINRGSNPAARQICPGVYVALLHGYHRQDRVAIRRPGGRIGCDRAGKTGARRWQIRFAVQ